MRDKKWSTYREAEDYILEIPKFTKKNTLAECKEFYKKLNSPASKLKIIHIAGTNGKGSVCSYLNNLLIESGCKTGMFTSPHLISMRERFKIEGIMVSEECFLSAFCKVMEKVDIHYHPTFFELLFFMAMIIFEEKKVDYIILETGLGGRLDATNIIEKPILTVLTEIGLDHMEYLGDSIEKIAMEKAGIIKPNIPVVYFDKKREISKLIEEKSRELNAPCHSVSIQTVKNWQLINKKIDFSFKSRYYDYVSLTLPTQALYQIENVTLAISAFELLEEGILLTEEKLKKAVFNTKWEGRMEEVFPNIFVDGAHNIDGMEAFIETVKATGQNENILVFSAVKEKEYPQMIKLLSESRLFEEIIITEISNERKADVKKLYDVFEQYAHVPIRIIYSVNDAFTVCLEKQKENKNIYIVGSLYLVGMIKRIVDEKLDIGAGSREF